MKVRSHRLAILGLFLVVSGCGGDAKVQVDTGPGNNTGPRVSGLVVLPNGQLSQSNGPLYRFASLLIAEAPAAFLTGSPAAFLTGSWWVPIPLKIAARASAPSSLSLKE